MQKIVFVSKVNSRNFVDDFRADLKNIIGGRLKTYEICVNEALNQAIEELYNKYPLVANVKIQISEFSNKSILVVVYGDVNAE
jgi:uncharacterized protein YbjQ (UPF0145 family)